MGYVDGKTDLDLILDGDASDDENELLSTTQVFCIKHLYKVFFLLLMQSCLDAMKDLRRRQQLMIVESREMAEALQEFSTGLRQQVVHVYHLKCLLHCVG